MVYTNAITVSGGSDENYSFTYVPADYEITKATLTVTADAQTKVYDGTRVAVISNAKLVGVLNNDIVSISIGLATFDNKEVANNKMVTINGSSISGTDAGNYILTELTGLFADITPKQLTIKNTSVVTNKMFNNTITAKVESVGTIQGIETADKNFVDVSAIANYNDATVGTDKVITTVFTISGSAANNYIKPIDLIINDAKISGQSQSVRKHGNSGHGRMSG